MSTLTLSPAEARQIASMEQAFATASIHQHYLTRAVYQPLTIGGLSTRVQEALGNGELYDKRYTKTAGDQLVFMADPSIPSHLVRQALQTAGVDRVVAECIQAESVLAAEQHLAGWAPLRHQLDYIPPDCQTGDVQAAYLAILHEILKTPGYRDQIGAELLEEF